jgi:hypothetical protein
MASRFLALGFRRTTGVGIVRRWFASYPPHEVVGMPSLSPVSVKIHESYLFICENSGGTKMLRSLTVTAVDY